jgi:2-polyprenyl-6-methoxyphenol hydroxylase-like FAD-dependent oxidoreductase
MRCAVIGAGPAGCLAARVLANAGAHVSLIDPALAPPRRARPQAVHVHVLPAPVWPRLEGLAPGLLNTLADLGVLHGTLGATTLDGEIGGTAVPWPDRARLDAALLDRCRHGLDLHAARVRRCTWDDSRWQVALGDGAELSADLLVDASGVRRVSFRSIAALVGAPIPVDVGPSGGAYASVSLRGLSLPRGRIGHRVLDETTGHRAILLQASQDRWRLTLQLRAGSPLPDSHATLMGILRGLRDQRLHRLFHEATEVGPIATWAAQRPMRAALETLRGLPSGWLPLGDALLTTPPALGQGIAQIVYQIEQLQTQHQAGHSIEKIRSDLCAAAGHQWMMATFLQGLDAA